MTLPKYKFIGQCNTFRKENQRNEEFWQQMIANRTVVNFEQFCKKCDLETLPFLESDTHRGRVIELAEYISDDPSSDFYCSFWEDMGDMIIVYFLQTSGFEFIFAK